MDAAYDIGVVKMWLPVQSPEEFEEGDDIEQDSSPGATPCSPAAAAKEPSPILVPQLRPYLSLQVRTACARIYTVTCTAGQ